AVGDVDAHRTGRRRSGGEGDEHAGENEAAVSLHGGLQRSETRSIVARMKLAKRAGIRDFPAFRLAPCWVRHLCCDMDRLVFTPARPYLPWLEPNYEPCSPTCRRAGIAAGARRIRAGTSGASEPARPRRACGPRVGGRAAAARSRRSRAVAARF